MKLRCSDGHDEIWSMNLEEDAKVKDGETVMVIFMPTAMEMRLERLPYMDKYGKDKREICLITDVCII